MYIQPGSCFVRATGSILDIIRARSLFSDARPTDPTQDLQHVVLMTCSTFVIPFFVVQTYGWFSLLIFFRRLDIR